MNHLDNFNPTKCPGAEKGTLIPKKSALLQLTLFLKIFFLCYVLLAGSMISAQASHFRYGNISWRQIGPDEVEFKVSMVFRRSYFSNPGLGATVTPDLTFFHGDGTSRAIQIVVTSVSVSEDWFYGEGTFTKKYPNMLGVYTAYFQSCCRIGSLRNNANANYQVETVVNLGTGNTSPVSTLPPIINLPQDVVNATFIIPAFDPNGDPLTFSTTPSAQMGSGSNPPGFSVDAATGIASFSTIGTSIGWLYNVSVTIYDNNGARIAVDFLIKIATASSPPIFVAPTPVSGTTFTVAAGQTMSFDVKAIDPDPSDIVTLQVVGLPPTALMAPLLPTSGPAGGRVVSSFSWTPPVHSVGTHIVNFIAEDNNGAQATSSVTIVVDPCNLSLDGTSSNVTCEGGADGSITLITTGGTAPFEYSIDNGASFQNSNVFENLTVGTYSAVAKDANACTATTSVAVIQHNDEPVINSLTVVPTGPINVASTVNASANVTDDNLTLAKWVWGDGGSDIEINPGAVINKSHKYLEAGLYQVQLIITDVCGLTATKNYEYVVVYDPNGGFVTGGGWINSPAGAYVADLTVAGRANFGIGAKYDNNAIVPKGQTQFQLHIGNFNFHSTSYDWLVMSGHKGHYKGSGTVNGTGDYGFLVSLVDGALDNSNPEDRFRIKIWNKVNGSVVYDNQGGADDAEATSAIANGSIVFHLPKGQKTVNLKQAGSPTESLNALSSFEAYPNPMVNSAIILFRLHESTTATLKVLDLQGKEIVRLFEGEVSKGAQYEVEFAPGNLRKGIYLTKLVTSSGKVYTKRLMIGL